MTFLFRTFLVRTVLVRTFLIRTFLVRTFLVAPKITRFHFLCFLSLDLATGFSLLSPETSWNETCSTETVPYDVATTFVPDPLNPENRILPGPSKELMWRPPNTDL